MALANQLKFITKLKKGQLRNFDEDKGTLSGSVHQAIMDNNYHRLVMLIDAGIGIKVGLTPRLQSLGILHKLCSESQSP